MAQVEAIEAVIAPTLDRLGFDVLDVELVGSGRGRTLRVSLDRDGGVDLDAVTEATEVVGPLLDRADVLPGSYTLEVSSPGVERTLRRPEHFARAVGETVSVKARTAEGTVARWRGSLVDATQSEITIDADGARVQLRYEDVLQARTVFEWGPAPKPGKGKRRHAPTKSEAS